MGDIVGSAGYGRGGAPILPHVDAHLAPRPLPVFVDLTGRRRARLRWLGAALGLASVGYLGVVALGVATPAGPGAGWLDPRVGQNRPPSLVALGTVEVTGPAGLPDQTGPVGFGMAGPGYRALAPAGAVGVPGSVPGAAPPAGPTPTEPTGPAATPDPAPNGDQPRDRRHRRGERDGRDNGTGRHGRDGRSGDGEGDQRDRRHRAQRPGDGGDGQTGRDRRERRRDRAEQRDRRGGRDGAGEDRSRGRHRR